jgi:phosphonate degradation associated HDIG domain protein
MSEANIIDQIFEAFRKYGDQLYDGGEQVTQQQHALQTAHAAEKDGASDTLIAAAILHDYGHLVHELPQEIVAQGIDDRHEELVAALLDPYFVPAVTEPARLHVPAKRYLCAVEPSYFNKLSPVSVRSLELQGGPLTEAEVKAFEALPYYADAVRLRRYDEGGKDPDAVTPDLAYYRPFLEAGLIR